MTIKEYFLDSQTESAVVGGTRMSNDADHEVTWSRPITLYKRLLLCNQSYQLCRKYSVISLALVLSFCISPHLSNQQSGYYCSVHLQALEHSGLAARTACEHTYIRMYICI